MKPADISIRPADRHWAFTNFGAAKQLVAEQQGSSALYTEGYGALEWASVCLPHSEDHSCVRTVDRPIRGSA